MFSQTCTFKILECHFPPGFFAEGRRGLAKKLVNSNMGTNMEINMGIPYKFLIVLLKQIEI